MIRQIGHGPTHRSIPKLLYRFIVGLFNFPVIVWIILIAVLWFILIIKFYKGIVLVSMCYTVHHDIHWLHLCPPSTKEYGTLCTNLVNAMQHEARQADAAEAVQPPQPLPPKQQAPPRQCRRRSGCYLQSSMETCVCGTYQHSANLAKCSCILKPHPLKAQRVCNWH